jgi:hypothetical protein
MPAGAVAGCSSLPDMTAVRVVWPATATTIGGMKKIDVTATSAGSDSIHQVPSVTLINQNSLSRRAWTNEVAAHVVIGNRLQIDA